ncbi:MAG: EamA family transporter [Planctomycetota bacterium]|nr:EamA family transporter [Planctomycetota bacterium]
MQPVNDAAPSRGRLIAAFAAVYILWGSTYVAIKFAVETLPPFTMAGVRFVTAGIILLAWTQLRGEGGATLRQWRSAAIAGALMMMASNGLVCWAEKRVDSSLAALLVATVPLWMMTLDWARRGGSRPSAATLTGVIVGLVGVAILVWPEEGRVQLDFAGVAALLVATLCWSIGSIYTRSADLPKSMIRATAMQMTCGGVLQFALGTALGELQTFEPDLVTAKSVWSLAYLLVAGSLVGFTAYIWLLRNTTAARAATYAYVNPIVAVILGAWLASEEITWRRLVGAGVVLLGVVLSLTASASSRARLATQPLPPDPPPTPAADSRRA